MSSHHKQIQASKVSGLGGTLRWAGMSIFLGSVLMGVTRRAYAANFLVTSNADAGPGTLRQAILDANASAGTDIITFQGVTSPILLTSGELTITDDVLITGPGSSLLTVSGNNVSRVINNSSSDSLISGLTLSNGRHAVSGGAVVNSGGLRLQACIVSGSTAPTGGGISNTGTLTLERTNVQGNTAQGPNGAAGANGGTAAGGGVYNGTNATLTLLDISYVTNNIAQGGNGGAGANGIDYVYNGPGDYDPGSSGSDGGRGGDAYGGGIFSVGAVNVTDGSHVDSNKVYGGNGGTGGDAGDAYIGSYSAGYGGDGGWALGGGTWGGDGAVISVQSGAHGRSTVSSNIIDAGNGADSGGNTFFSAYGGSGGTARGGGIFSANGSIQIQGSDVNDNDAYSGSGGSGFGAGNVDGFAGVASGGGIGSYSGSIQITAGGAVNENALYPANGGIARGGGIYTTGYGSFGTPGSTVTIDAGQVAGNYIIGDTYAYGGGIFAFGSYQEIDILNDSYVGDNYATINSYGTASGGGIFATGGPTYIEINASAVDYNTVAGSTTNNVYGGGIRVYAMGSLLLTNGASCSGNAANAGTGNFATGGGISITSDNFNLTVQNDSSVVLNTAKAGNSGLSTPGDAMGAGISLIGNNSIVSISDSQVSYNQALGGQGSNGLGILPAGSGGDARGGGISINGNNTAVYLNNAQVDNNSAVAGSGGNGSIAGSGGNAYGGNLFSNGDNTSITINDGSLASGYATAGSGGNGNTVVGPGGAGGSGGDSFGGSLYIKGDFVNLGVDECLLTNNTARGGSGGQGQTPAFPSSAGGNGGNAGNAKGGAIAINGSQSRVSVTSQSGLTDNTAIGGDGGVGGNATSGAGPISPPGGNGGNAGYASGGAINSVGNYNTIIVDRASVTGNDALAGNAGSGGYSALGYARDGYGGLARGGGICIFGDYTRTEIEDDSSVSGNVARAYDRGDNIYQGSGIGGGVYAFGYEAVVAVDSSSKVNLNQARSQYNRASGGGIFIGGEDSSLQINYSEVNNNLARAENSGLASGAGIFSGSYGGDSSLYVNFSDIRNNSAFGQDVHGAGILTYGSGISIDIRYSDVENNSGVASIEARGGGIAVTNSNSTLITYDSSISQNKLSGAYVNGGGIFVDDSYLTIYNANIRENTITGFSEAFGGGVSHINGSLYVFGSTISENSVESFGDVAAGGGLHAYRVDTTIVNSYVSENSLAGAGDVLGGGVYAYNRYLGVSKTKISNNHGYSQNGTASGGGIYFYANDEALIVNQSSNISDNVVYAFGVNSSAAGGGIFFYSDTDANLQVEDSNINSNAAYASGNQSFAAGGGVYVGGNDASASLENSIISRNFSVSRNNAVGGGIAVDADNSSVTLDQSTLKENGLYSGNQIGLGSGIVSNVVNGGGVNIYDTTFEGNVVYGYSAGSVVARKGDVLISGSTLANNNGFYAGGILTENGDVTVTNSTIAYNSGYSGALTTLGGENGNITINNSTITGNQVGVSHSGDGNVALNSTIVAGNSYRDVVGTVSGSFNLIGNNTDLVGLTDNVNGNIVGDSTNPIDPQLGPLQNNGGPTQTMALLGGRALNAGSNSLSLTVDQRGQPRVFGASADIGAFELQGLPPSGIPIPAITVNEDAVPGTIDLSQFFLLTQSYSVQNSPSLLAAAVNANILTLTYAPNQFGSGTVIVRGEGADFSFVDTVLNFTINPVADTPNVTPGVANGTQQTTAGLVITPNAVDGAEVTHFKINNILGGTLFQNDGVTPIVNGDFITIAQGGAGLKFTPDVGALTNGSFDVQASIGNTDAGLGGEVVVATINNAPTVTSPATATPSTAGPGQTVSFAVGFADSDGTFTITWDFGDSTTGTGANTTHAYTTPGTYTVVATATDDSGAKVTSSVQVVVVAPIVGTGLDSDGDGFSDEIETAAGSNPLNGTSTPIGAAAGAPPLSLTLTKMAIKLNFAKAGGDSIGISGALPVPAGFSPSGKQVLVDVGGVMKSFTLDAKGASPKGNDSIKLSVKATKGVVAQQMAKFAIKMSKGSFASALADEGLTGAADAKNANKTVRVDVIFNGATYRKDQAQIYSAKAGKTGATKSPK